MLLGAVSALVWWSEGLCDLLIVVSLSIIKDRWSLVRLHVSMVFIVLMSLVVAVVVG